MMNRYYLPCENFDLDQIGNSGQCFRWFQEPVDVLLGRWKFYIFDHLAIAWRDRINYDDAIVVDTDVSASTLYYYFDMNTDYKNIISQIPVDDTYLQKAAKMFSGIRILRQNIWEVFISFIISQNNNISRIKKSIDLICQDNQGRFPQPYELGNMNLDKYNLDYRKSYIEEYLRSDKFYVPLYSLDYQDAFEYYQSFKGIGPKVANCICLFGLHYLEACPVDTWMKRIIDNRYNGQIPVWMYSKYAGVYQQYCFCYERYLDGRDK